MKKFVLPEPSRGTHELISRPELNGLYGWVRNYIPEKERYEVAVEGRLDFLLLIGISKNIEFKVGNN